MKKLLFITLISVLYLTSKGQAKFYLSCQAFQPWGTNTNINAMNQAFGVGNWTQAYYPSVNVNALFQPTVCLIFMEGGDSHANCMNTFLTANMAAIQNWVFAGGRLLLNAAPNQGGNINYGFGGMMLNYNWGPYSSTATNAAGQAGHPIFNGPALPCGTAYTGNYWCHGYVTGVGHTQLVIGQTPGCSLAEKPWGAGLAMFGSMTTPNWHSPTLNAANFLSNVLTYLYVCCTQPTITIAATPTSVCAGFPTTLIASGAGVGGTYTWTPPAGGATVTGATQVFSPTATGVYSVAGTNTAGCVGNTTIQIVVNPTPTITAVANPTGVCLGQTSSTITVGGGVTYTTQPGNITGTNVIVSPLVATIYTVTGANAFGCISSTTVQVGINPSATATANSPSVCAGSPLNLTAGGGATYLWIGPGSFTSNVQNPVIAAAQASNSGQYSVVVTSALGCTAQAVTNATVVVVTPPTITHNAPNGICVGNTLSLNATGGNGTYAWSGPNGFMSALQSPTIGPISLLGSGVYSVVTTVSTCTAMTTQSILVNPLPNPLLVSNSPVCLFEQITFTATGGVSYTIAGPNGYTSNNPMASIPVANNISAGIYTLTTSDVNGCVNRSTATVAINPLPIISAVGSTVCANKTINLSVSGGVTYTWTGPLNFNSNQSNPTIPNAQIQMAGNYTVQVINANGCKSASVANVAVHSLPSPTAGASSPICTGKNIELSAGDQFADGFIWNGPNGFFTQIQNPVIKEAETTMSGIYTVTATDKNGCQGVAYIPVVINPLPTAIVVSKSNKGCVPVCATFSTESSGQVNNLTWTVDKNTTIGTGPVINNCFKYAGNYLVGASFTDNNGCEGKTSSFEVNVYPIPVADFNISPVKPIVNEEVEFSDASTGAKITQWTWHFTEQKNNIVMAPSHKITYENAGAYPIAFIVSSNYGCTDTIVKSVVVGEDFNLYVPNAFSPNGDGVNDIFQPKGYGIVKYELNIFDRWGEKLFTSNDLTQGWNGTFVRKNNDVLQDGVYVWNINVTNIFGKSKELKGTVTLLK